MRRLLAQSPILVIQAYFDGHSPQNAAKGEAHHEAEQQCPRSERTVDDALEEQRSARCAKEYQQ
jgi:hypothetical protein